MTTSNETRAERAQNALRFYVEAKGEVFENSSSEIADLVADLLHLAVRTDEGDEPVESTLRLARMHFEAEHENPEEEAGTGSLKRFIVTVKITKWETYEVEAESPEDAEANYGLEAPVSESGEDLEIQSVVEKRSEPTSEEVLASLQDLVQDLERGINPVESRTLKHAIELLDAIGRRLPL